MPVDLQPSNSADENVNSSSGSICSPATSSSSPSSMSSYESSQYHHQTSSPTHNNHHLHPSHHHHLSHLHPTLTQCIKLESFMHSPVSSPTSPRSSITSDISPSPYDHHLDVVDKNCTGDDHDIFDFASLLSWTELTLWSQRNWVITKPKVIFKNINSLIQQIFYISLSILFTDSLFYIIVMITFFIHSVW